MRRKEKIKRLSTGQWWWHVVRCGQEGGGWCGGVVVVVAGVCAKGGSAVVQVVAAGRAGRQAQAGEGAGRGQAGKAVVQAGREAWWQVAGSKGQRCVCVWVWCVVCVCVKGRKVCGVAGR